jgi:hypothetical protein
MWQNAAKRFCAIVVEHMRSAAESDQFVVDDGLPERRRVIEFGATILEYFGAVAGVLPNSET